MNKRLALALSIMLTFSSGLQFGYADGEIVEQPAEVQSEVEQSEENEASEESSTEAGIGEEASAEENLAETPEAPAEEEPEAPS